MDSSIKMQTPEGIEYILFPAGIPIRACAWGIDFLFRGVVLIALFILSEFTEMVMGVWVFFILNFALNWFYYVIFEMIWNGQSPGKRIMGIRTVGGDGSPVKPGASFLRNMLRFADGFFYLYLLAFIVMSASPGFRRIGDWAADTLVIYTARSRLPVRFTPPALLKQEAIPWLADVPVITPPAKLSYEEKQGLLMFARRYPQLGKKRADEIARAWTLSLELNDEISDSQYLLGIARSISGNL